MINLGKRHAAGPIYAFSILTACASIGPSEQLPPVSSSLSRLTQIAEVDERFQSYNIEMVEVTGGRFWAPYGGPPGERYRQRPPADLANTRLRQLAQHLRPHYIRVSGTWANSTYIARKGENPGSPPSGFRQVLTDKQWMGLVDFARAMDAPLVLSFPVAAGTRDENNVWTTAQSQRLVDMTREAGGTIAAAEFFNEPNVPALSGLPAGYSAKDYARDFAIFRAWFRRVEPKAKILGPGSVGEGGVAIPVVNVPGIITSEEMLAETAGAVDALSYHYYGGVSQRCQDTPAYKPTASDAVSQTWLEGIDKEYAYYAAVRDRFVGGKDIWLTETAQAACGGSPWAKTYRDIFRYVSQNGRLAQKAVRSVMHNTLAASDYALIDEDSLEPRPNYWAAVLWARVMGKKVLEPLKSEDGLLTYAHCLKGVSGGVAIAAVNVYTTKAELEFGETAEAFVVTASNLDAETVEVNGTRPIVNASGSIEGLTPVTVYDRLTVPGHSIVYLAVSDANNLACR